MSNKKTMASLKDKRFSSNEILLNESIVTEKTIGHQSVSK
jgi:hypothetical protein